MIVNSIGVSIADILIENLPVGLFFIGIIGIGNILRHISLGNDLEDICREKIKFDAFSLISGLTVMLFSLFYIESSLNLDKLLDDGTWIIICVVFFISGFFIWNYRIYGKKWIKDQVLNLFLVYLGAMFFVIGFNVIKEVGDIFAYKDCLDNICVIKFLIDKIVRFALAIFFMVSGLRLFKFINKDRRYRKKKR